MDRYDDADISPDMHERETHATTGGAAAAGAVTGGVIGLTGGPVGAVVGAVGGAIVGAAAERMMHSDDDADRDTAIVDSSESTISTTSTTTSDITTRPAASVGDRESLFVERNEEIDTTR